MDNIARGINLAGSTVSAQDDAFLYHMISGTNGVFNYRSRLECTAVSANQVRIGDGMAQVQGRNYIVYPDATVELEVDSGSQGMKRRDIVVVEFSKEENEELMELKIVKGEEAEDNPTDPELIQTDTLESGICYQMPLYRININGINLEGIDDLREYIPSLKSAEGYDLGLHNATPRGADLINERGYTIDEIYNHIQNGFGDIYPGDFFDITITSSFATETVRVLILENDPFYNYGDTALRTHHCACTILNCFETTSYMNSTNTSEGGYEGSYMYNSVLPEYEKALDAVLGDHLLEFRTYVTNVMNSSYTSMAGANATGAATGGEWVTTRLKLFSSAQVAGITSVCSSRYDAYSNEHQFALFRLVPKYIVAGRGGTEYATSRQTYWLSSITNATAFAHVVSGGTVSNSSASSIYGVRPLFLIG